jgi:hypothetical protein
MTHEDEDHDYEPDEEMGDKRVGRISVGGGRNPFDSSGEYFWKCARCGGHYLQYFHDMQFRVGLIAMKPSHDMLVAFANEQRQAWNTLVDDDATCRCDNRTHHKVPMLTGDGIFRLFEGEG